MLQSILDVIISLLNQVSIFIVVVYILTRTKFYSRIDRHDFTLRNKLFLIVIFGLCSIYGTVKGIRGFGVIANTRDVGPAIAGLLGGPWIGLGAAGIGVLHRWFMPGLDFTRVPCCLATLASGLAGGLIYNFRKGKLISWQGAVVFGVLIEIFHMILVLLISRPFDKALLAVEQVAAPMIIATAFALGFFIFILVNYRKEQETKAAKEKIESELKIAHEIQNSILPRVFPPFPDRREFDIYALMDPAKEVGGDFYDFFFVDRNKLCFLIGDVSGKGVPAALFMMISKTLLKAEAMRGLSPDEILRSVNRIIVPDNDSFMFVTLFCVILNIENGEIEFSNGGHNPPLIYSGGSGFEYLEVPKGLVVGVNEAAVFELGKMKLQPNDCLFIYTDGVTEAMDHKNELFSEKRLQGSLTEYLDKGMPELIRGVRAKLHDFAQGAMQSDDITMLALRYRG